MKYIITERQLKFLTEAEESDYEVSPKSNVAYHITPDIFLNQIQQVGLVPKSESKLSYHPERIYLFMNPEMDKEMTNVLWNATKKETRDKINDYYVLQVDLTQIPNHRFYLDRDSSFSYVALFTLEPIPSSAIKVIKKIPVSDLKQDPSPEEQNAVDDEYDEVMARMRGSLKEYFDPIYFVKKKLSKDKSVKPQENIKYEEDFQKYVNVIFKFTIKGNPLEHLKGFEVLKVTPSTDFTVLLRPKVNDWFNYCKNTEYLKKLEKFENEFKDLAKMMGMGSPFSEQGLPQNVSYAFWNHC